MNFIVMKNRMNHTFDDSYSMAYDRFKKAPRIPPVRLADAEARTVAAVIVSSKGLQIQREMMVDLMLQIDDESFNKVIQLIGPDIMSEIMPTC